MSDLYDDLKDAPALSIACLMAIAPNCGAGTDDSAPRNEPMGVRTALTITTS